VREGTAGEDELEALREQVESLRRRAQKALELRSRIDDILR
jgi:hypothetical protein